MVTIKDIAHAAGVSQSTVSLALNQKSVVNPQTRQRIQALAEQMGYVPNTFARGFAQGRSGIAGLVLSDSGHAQQSRLFTLCNQAAADAGLRLLVRCSMGDAANEVQCVDDLIALQAHYILIVPVGSGDAPPAYMQRLEASASAYAFMLGGAGHGGLPGVLCDTRLGAKLATEHLLGLQHRRICLLSAPAESTPATLLMQGAHDACDALALPRRCIGALEVTTPGFAAAYQATRMLLESRVDFTAMLVEHDAMALGAIQALQQSGRNVPGDVSVCGFGNSDICDMATPPLTSIDANLPALTHAAIELAAAGTAPDTPPVLIPPRLVTRQSTQLCRRI